MSSHFLHKDVNRKITEHTKAIIPIHIQGFPCDTDEITAIAKAVYIYVNPDSTQEELDNLVDTVKNALAKI